MVTQQSATATRTLPADVYRDPAVFAAEHERIFTRHWVNCGRARQIAEPGQHVMVQIGPESLILLRDHGGELRAFYNVCRHRGTRLCNDETGALPRTIQCPYHAWTYDLTGRLIGAPHMEELPGFDKADYPLFSVALAEWEGSVFINLSPDPEPFAAAFAPLMGKFAAWHLPDLRVGGSIEYDVAANWKLIVENYSECYHCPGVHPELSALSPYRSGVNDLTDGPFLGGPSRIDADHGSLTVSGRACSLPVGDVSGDDLHRVYYYTLFPNTLLSLHPDYVMVHTLWPLAPDRTRIVCQWLFDPRAADQPDYRPQEAVTFWDTVNRQDWHVCELTQQGLSSRVYHDGPYSALETMALAFDHHYRSMMSED